MFSCVIVCVVVAVIDKRSISLALTVIETIIQPLNLRSIDAVESQLNYGQNSVPFH